MCKPSHIEQTGGWGPGGGPWYVLQCSQLWGRWSSDDPACKTTAAKFAKCLESRGVSHLSPAQTNPKQPACTCGKQESSSGSSAARLWKHASTPPTTPPPQSAFHPFSRAAPLDRYYITFLFCSSLQARRQRRQKPDLTHFPDFPSPARAARRAHLGPERRDGGSVQERAVTPCFASKCFPLLLLNERLLQAGESGTSLGLKPKAGSAWKPREKLPPLRRFHPGGGGSGSARPSALSPAQHIWWDLRRRKWRA